MKKQSKRKSNEQYVFVIYHAMMSQHQLHWTEKLWKELDSISTTQQSIEGILVSRNLNNYNIIPTNNWTKDAKTTNKKNKYDNVTSCNTNIKSKKITTAISKKNKKKEVVLSNENFSSLIHQSFEFSKFEDEKQKQSSTIIANEGDSKLTSEEDDDSDEKINILPTKKHVTTSPTPKTEIEDTKLRFFKDKKKMLNSRNHNYDKLHRTFPLVSPNEIVENVKHDNEMKGLMNRYFSTKPKPTDAMNGDHLRSTIAIGTLPPSEDDNSDQSSLYRIIPVSSSCTMQQIIKDCKSNQIDIDGCDHDVIQLPYDDNAEHQNDVSNESWRKYLASVSSSTSSASIKNDCEDLQRIQDSHLSCKKVSSFCEDEYSEVTMVDSLHRDYNGQEGMF